MIGPYMTKVGKITTGIQIIVQQNKYVNVHSEQNVNLNSDVHNTITTWKCLTSITEEQHATLEAKLKVTHAKRELNLDHQTLFKEF